METIIYGASDDLLEISGAYSEELNPPDEEFHVAVSDGTLLRINYDGDWRIKAEVRGKALKKIVHSVGEDAEHNDPYAKCSSYSDLAVFEGEIRYVGIVRGLARFRV